MELWQIISAVLAVIATFFGFYWLKAKNVITEIGILFTIIAEALKDDTLTKEELELILTQIKKILNSFKKKTIQEASQIITNMQTKKHLKV